LKRGERYIRERREGREKERVKGRKKGGVTPVGEKKRG
jgi:hypothetical protein